MAKSVNKVIILGNLGRDPESKFMTNGTHLCKFSVATSRSYKQGEEWKEETEWHNVILWGKEKLAEYLHKGSKVYIEGRLKSRSWEDPTTGQKKYATEIIAEEIVLLDGKREGGAAASQTTEPTGDWSDDGDAPPF